MDSWQKLSLRLAGVRLIDCDHRTPVATESGYAYIAIPQLRDGHIDFSSARRISESDYRLWTTRAKPQRNDVVLSRRTNPGVTAAVRGDPEFALGQNLVLLRSDGTKVYPPFLRWLVRGPEWWRQIAKYLNVGAVFDSLKCADVPHFELTIPPIRHQKSIAAILDALDDKIDLNRRINITLEAMSRTLFKSWFVDFYPVRAKSKGAATGLRRHIESAFPSQFEASELGPIPRGWRVGSIYEISDVKYGAPFASNLFNVNHDGRPLIRIRDLKDENPATWTTEEHPKGYLVSPGDIVVGMDGEFRAYLWGGPEAWLNQRVCVFTPQKGHSHAFVRNSIIGPLAEIESTEIGTTVIHLGKSDIDRFRVVIPTNDVLRVYNEISIPLYARIIAAKQESRNLAAIRDGLLPKLISGEFHAKDAEKIVSAAA